MRGKERSVCLLLHALESTTVKSISRLIHFCATVLLRVYDSHVCFLAKIPSVKILNSDVPNSGTIEGKKYSSPCPWVNLNKNIKTKTNNVSKNSNKLTMQIANVNQPRPCFLILHPNCYKSLFCLQSSYRSPSWNTRF